MTDNTEAVEKLAEIIRNDEFDRRYAATMAKAILAAIQVDPLAYVKPKPPTWSNVGDRWVCELFSVDYYVIHYDRRSSVGDYSLFIRGIWTPYYTLEAAQAAAYDDLCNRVKELF